MPRNLFTNQLSSGDFPRGLEGLQSGINKNYQIAIAYYQQREIAFERVIVGRAGSFKQKYKDMVQKATNTWLSAIKTDFYKVLNSALKGSEIKNTSKMYKSGDLEYRQSLDDLVSAFLAEDEAGKIIKKGNIGWGSMLEKWLEQRLSGPSWAAQISSYAQNSMASLMEMHGFGTSKQASAVTGGRRAETRTDLYAGNKLESEVGQLELTAWLDFADLDDKLTPAVITNQLVQAIQQAGIDTDIYGFQVKAYINGSDSLRWSNSQTIINQLNAIFSNGAFWSTNYASIYPYYYLSKYILNIVGPVNIGVITPKGLEYMSDFLSKYNFYCEVTFGMISDDEASAERGGGNEAYRPRAVGNQILTRSTGKGALQFQGMVLSSQGQGKWGNQFLSNVLVAQVRYAE